MPTQLDKDVRFLRAVLAASDDCIKVIDLDGTLEFMSEGGQRVMEVQDFEVIRGCPWMQFWEGASKAEAEAALAAARAGNMDQASLAAVGRHRPMRVGHPAAGHQSVSGFCWHADGHECRR